MKRTSLFRLSQTWGLGLLLLVAPAAHAQTLNLHDGDTVTVSGAGTVGTINGQPVANTTNTYTDMTGEAAVDTQGTAAFTLASGGTLAVSDGSYALFAVGSGPISIIGGSITGDQSTGVAAEGTGTLTMSGGSIDVGVLGVGIASSSGPVVVSGGSIASGQDGITLLATGGSITVTGGAVTAGLYGTGLYSDIGSVINLFSQNDTPFLINGVPMNNTALAHYTAGRLNTISGILLDGEMLNTTFYNGGTFNLNVGPIPAPEPSQFMAFAVGVLGLGALTLKASKRPAA